MDEHPLSRFASTPNSLEAAEWVHAHGAGLAEAVGHLLRGGMAVRLSSVGYGRALRIAATDGRGWTCGWTVGSLEELRALCSGLLAAGGIEYVEALLEKPNRPGRR